MKNIFIFGLLNLFSGLSSDLFLCNLSDKNYYFLAPKDRYLNSCINCNYKNDSYLSFNPIGWRILKSKYKVTYKFEDTISYDTIFILSKSKTKITLPIMPLDSIAKDFLIFSMSVKSKSVGKIRKNSLVYHPLISSDIFIMNKDYENYNDSIKFDTKSIDYFKR